MRFGAREDIELPAEAVFAALSDFERFERAALRRGAEVLPAGRPRPDGTGRGWIVSFRYRGRKRELVSEVTRNEPPRKLWFDGRIGGLDGRLALDLVALSPRRTRLSVELEILPRTLSARLLIQSLRLAKGRLNARFRKRIGDFRADIERRAVRSV